MVHHTGADLFSVRFWASMTAAGFRYQIFTFLANLSWMFDSQVSEHGRGAAMVVSGLVSPAEQTLDRTRVYGFKEAPDDASFTDGITPLFRVINSQHPQPGEGQNHVRFILSVMAVRIKKDRVNFTSRRCLKAQLNVT